MIQQFQTKPSIDDLINVILFNKDDTSETLVDNTTESIAAATAAANWFAS